MTIGRIERGTPSAWKRSRSEIPNTTYGMTSGLRRNAETAALPAKRRRASAIEASVPRTTAAALESAATIALVSSAPSTSGSVRNWWYQVSVNPLSGNVGNTE